MAMGVGAIGALGAPGAGADTKSDLKAAKAQLQALEGKIADERSQVAAVQAQLAATAASLHDAQQRQLKLAAQVAEAESELEAAQDDYDIIRARLDERARQAYIGGPLSGLQILLGSQSLSELSDGLEFADRLSQQDSDLAAEVQDRAAAIATKRQNLQALLATQNQVVKDLTDQQNTLATQFAQQQTLLASLASAKAQADKLISSLKQRLAAEELAAAQRALGGGMTITYGEWAGNLLGALGMSACRNNLVVVVAWETTEYTAAGWNPLATTLYLPGSTKFNAAGVRNYLSLGQGLEATTATLRLPGNGYESILGGLAACADPMATGEAINASQWCRGCSGGRYVTAIIPAVEQYYDQYAGR